MEDRNTNALSVRALQIPDRSALANLLAADGLFHPEELACALELIDAALADPAGEYRVLIADLDGAIAGYICYGPTPMTRGTWDLYWVVTDPRHRGRGVASTLVAAMEVALRTIGARMVRVETSNLDGYGAAHRFYVRSGYPEAARLEDFYRVGEDLLILMKRL